MRDLVRAARPQAEVRLVKSGGGVFEIMVDGDRRFSKKALGRFPTDAEVASAIA